MIIYLVYRTFSELRESFVVAVFAEEEEAKKFISSHSGFLKEVRPLDYYFSIPLELKLKKS